jgi:aryl carrier-like protein
LLGIGQVSRHDNFFTLGGDSLLATRLVAAIRRELHIPVSLRMLLEAPTIAELAPAVTPAQADASLVEEGVL